MSFTFESADVPAITGSGGRVAEPNPFIDVVKSMPVVTGDVAREGAAKRFTVPGIIDKTNVELQKVIRQLNQAGKEAGVTVRKLTADVKGKTPSVAVTFWCTPQVKRGENTPAATSA